jgi:hypothetical protein
VPYTEGWHEHGLVEQFVADQRNKHRPADLTSRSFYEFYNNNRGMW